MHIYQLGVLLFLCHLASTSDVTFDLDCGVEYGCWVTSKFRVMWKPVGDAKVEIQQVYVPDEMSHDCGGDHYFTFGLSKKDEDDEKFYEEGNDFSTCMPDEEPDGDEASSDIPTGKAVVHSNSNKKGVIKFGNQDGLSNGSLISGTLLGCKYQRVDSDHDARIKYFSMEKQYYLSVYLSHFMDKLNNTEVCFHQITDHKVRLTSKSVISDGVAPPAFVNNHATIMSVAWGFVAPLAVLVIKLGRKPLKEYKVLNRNPAILIHGALNVCCLLMTMGAAIYMMVELGEIDVSLHTIFGTIVMFTCMIQLTLGIFHVITLRYQWLYWTHRCLGAVLTYGALINIFLGILRVVKSGGSRSLYIFYALLCCVVGVGYLLLEILSCTADPSLGRLHIIPIVLYVLALIILVLFFGIEMFTAFFSL